MALHISGVNYESIADARGVSCTIFFSGCRHLCVGCHSKETWDFNYGELATDEMARLISYEINKRPYVTSITLSGGDPMYSAKEVKEFIKKLPIQGKEIWCYSGFTVEELLEDKEQKELLMMCDVLVDGKFEVSERNITIPFRGSNNQRIINLKELFNE